MNRAQASQARTHRPKPHASARARILPKGGFMATFSIGTGQHATAEIIPARRANREYAVTTLCLGQETQARRHGLHTAGPCALDAQSPGRAPSCACDVG